jgi:hypothetical protein
MTYLYPAFLFGLLSVVIPIIIHLFNFQRPREVVFTRVNFLKNIQQESSRSLKLKHLLVLLCRILFLGFLVLAFAQPFLKGKNPDIIKGNKDVSVYLDNSFSMENQLGDQRAFDVALKSASSLAGLFSPSTRYMLISNDFEGRDQFLKNKEKFTERITELSYSPAFRSLNEVFSRNESLINQGEKKLFFVFSDFQKSSAGELSHLTVPDSLTEYYLVPVQNKEVANVFVDSVWLSSPLVRVNENNTIKVKISNSGNEDISGYKVTLLLDDTQVSLTTVDIPAKASMIAELPFSIAEKSVKKGMVVIEDNPVRFDNTFYFTLDAGAKADIYLVSGSTDNSVKNVLSNEDGFNLETVKEGEINFSKIASSDVVILDEVKEISEALKEAVADYLNHGGALIVIPSASSDLVSYRQAFPQLMLAAEAKDTSRKAEFTLQAPDYKNPFFSGVFEKEEKFFQMPFAFPVISPGAYGVPVLKFRNNKPFLSRYKMGQGDVFLFTAPLLKDYSNFSRNALFVPVMYRAIFLSYKNGGKLAYNFSEPVINIKVKDNPGNEIFSLNSGEVKLIPSQKIKGNMLQMEVPEEKMKAGFYDLKSENEKHLIAFNYSPAESSMEFYSREDLKKAFAGRKNIHIFDVSNSEQFADMFKNTNIGTPLWKYCLILSLIFLLTEILLIRFL